MHASGTASKQSRLAPLLMNSEEHASFQGDSILEMLEAGMHCKESLNRKQQQSCARAIAQAEHKVRRRKQKAKGWR